MMDELGLDDEESQITFNFQNLNYVKRKLFDPEIRYLMIKFKESFAEQKVELLKKNQELVQEYKTKIEGDIQIVTSMNHDTKNEQAGIKRFNAQITDIMESVITKVESCEKELQHQ